MPTTTFSDLVAATTLILLASTAELLAGSAFPGAVGYGQSADGWKGGLFIPVTTLEDSGPGSLRACAELGPQPKICGFRIGGSIFLDRPIRVSSNTYIAGQTAPGDGVEIRLGNGDRTPVVIKNVHDVIVRFLKIRPGPGVRPSANIDAVTIENAEDVYLDHLSLMFASDEVLNVHVSNSRVANVTVANSIIAYGLDDAGHPKGRHSKGALICSDEGARKECGRITLWRNLFAHNRDRNPDIKGTDVGPIEVINNVFYNPISQFGEFYDLLGNAEIAYIGNHALAGPSTIEDVPEAVQIFEWTDTFQVILTAHDNVATDRGRCNRDDSFAVLDPAAEAAATLAPDIDTVAPVRPAADTFESVLSDAGDRLRTGRGPDAIDALVTSDVRKCRGRVIDHPDELGGWPELQVVRGPADADGDGLPDDWEIANGTDPATSTPLWDPSEVDGLSVLEHYLATLAGDIP